jgi:KDO2-lipid IV(A) lauroyltransferase
MGELLAAGSGQAVAFAMASVLEKGGHLGLLVDQRLTRGFKIDFFGRPASTNPILGRLARQFDCPVHGVRVVRLPGNRFRLDLTPPIELPRDEEGLIDPEGAMRVVNATVEGWVRENPGQWLWLHNRWRM